MNNLTQTPIGVNSAPVPAYPSTLTAPQKFTVAPHVRMDNAFIDAWAPKLSGNAFKVLMLLLRWKGDSNEAHPRKRTLCAACNLSMGAIERALKQLCDVGLIESRAWFDEARDGGQSANRYFFLLPAHNLNPPPVSKTDVPPYPKFNTPKQRNREKLKTEEQSSVTAEIVVADSKRSFVEEADETLLANLDALGALNATTRRLVIEQPDEAARQIENLRRAQLKGAVHSPPAWFNSAVQRQMPLREVKAPVAPATGSAPADVANAGARHQWKPANRPQNDGYSDTRGRLKATLPEGADDAPFVPRGIELGKSEAERQDDACEAAFEALSESERDAIDTLAKAQLPEFLKYQTGSDGARKWIAKERRLQVWSRHRDKVTAWLDGTQSSKARGSVATLCGIAADCGVAHAD